MTNPSITEYLKYSTLQLAAEAFLRDENTCKLATTDAQIVTALLNGNGHASRFTNTEADAFIDNGWKVLDQCVNTGTGFSGTLFQNIETDELVISFRSTEFVDDAVRDSLATNTYEIKATGFAWGQIADMEEWYAKLQADPSKLGNKSFSVTGYSLGGHLATAFNLLHTDEADQVVTFNGAGVGKVTQGTLASALDEFNKLREDPVQITAQFADSGLTELYNTIRMHLSDHSWTAQEAKATIIEAYVGETMSTDAQALLSALSEIAELQEEAARVPTLRAGSSGMDLNIHPKKVDESQVDALSLDYRMAVKFAARNTEAASLVDGVIQAYGNKEYLDIRFANQYDVVGDTKPSAVAHSLWHAGQDVRIFIEDQPLYRGGIGADLANAALDYGSVKLLVDGYATKGFGDTHSLILLVDSLSIQDSLLNLVAANQRNSVQASLAEILRAESYLKGVNGDLLLGSGQGMAEGDVMENVVNTLSALFFGPDSPYMLKGDPNGNTWARIDNLNGYTGRSHLHDRLDEITNSTAYKNLVGKLDFSFAASPSATAGREDFGNFLSLYTLSPLAFHFSSVTDVPAAWDSVYEDWVADNLLLEQDEDSVELAISNKWMIDRADFLQRKLWFNINNVNPSNARPIEANDSNTGHPYLTDSTYFEDAASDYIIAQGYAAGNPYANIHRFYFGDSKDNTHVGGGVADHLYGMSGNDYLYGQGGDDYLEGGNGADNLIGGADNDELWGNADDDNLWGGDGDDELHGGSGIDKLMGGNGNDTLWGGSGNDSLWGQEGNDELYGGSGDDYLSGDAGNNEVHGGSGDDYVDGGADSDKLWGDEGDDVLRGYDGDDWLDGGEGDDLLMGGAGNNTLIGGGGSDVLNGSDGINTFVGDTGSTYIIGGSEHDKFFCNSAGSTEIHHEDGVTGTGVIYLDGVKLGGVFETNYPLGSSWHDSYGNFYRRDSWMLYINDSITIFNFANGSYGITYVDNFANADSGYGLSPNLSTVTSGIELVGVLNKGAGEAQLEISLG
ncbi:hypothetical protein SOM61_21320 [Massilia sp. CFBP9012]|uniref:hypothetical protein n=1 Tax=Massilia sp. CFBP9012 TaxID=3096531 RepID=UPI002A6AE2AF|nr:hypothetical protein [Massilia sp. CFBP9012]MDY0977509.1 hypothetical protein [Massilia sp. CFBP9012]